MSIRKYTNPRELDVSKGLQEVLRNNGIQAHISIDPKGSYQLVVLGHDSPVLRYNITDEQVDKLMNWGTNFANKKAYDTFTGIVKDDFDMPDGFVSARNVGGRVISGLHGYRIGNGEYGCRRPYSYHGPYHMGRRGWGGDFLSYSPRLFSPGFHGRRIDGRYYSSGPIVAIRPDDRMKPGELRSGGYGFYYKGGRNQEAPQEALDYLNLSEAKLEPLKSAPRPIGQAMPYNKVITSDAYFSIDNFYDVLKSHGILIDTENKTMTIQSSSARVDLQYTLNEDEINLKYAVFYFSLIYKHLGNKKLPRIWPCQKFHLTL